MSFKRSLCWIRRDLRLSDNTALHEACQQSELVAIVFVFDHNILSQLRNRVDRRLVFIHQSLQELSKKIEGQKSRLIVLQGDPTVEIPNLAERLHIEAVFANEDYEPYAKQRDSEVGRTLKSFGSLFFTFKDQVVFSGSEILKQDGTPYQRFTPYKKNWLGRFRPVNMKPRVANLERLMPAYLLKGEESLPTLTEVGFKPVPLEISSGEDSGLRRLTSFSKSGLVHYDKRRDLPMMDGTSHLSVHLRFGTVSVRTAIAECLSKKGQGATSWLSELIWREFYFMILDRFPHVENHAFQRQYDEIQWPGSKEHFEAWTQGQTGYPMVDAGMRQLNATGFMHNRLRMITASFLVKDLLVDWRQGEAYFAERLLDFDLAANNGGWQWCASTGCDAQPYFRIFNPNLQASKFDPKNQFIKKWVPEAFSTKGIKYSAPVVDHDVQKKKAVALFKAYKSSVHG